MAREFLTARKEQKAGDHRQIRAFRNLTLGLPEPILPAETTPVSALLARRAKWTEPLPGIVWRVGSVDCQVNRLEALVTAWKLDEQCYLERHMVFPGDPLQDAVWRDLAEEIPRMGAHIVLIDEGGVSAIGQSQHDYAGTGLCSGAHRATDLREQGRIVH